MSETGMMTFRKEERLCSRTLIERLFNGGGSRSMAAFPLRLVTRSASVTRKSTIFRIMILTF